MSFPEIYNTAKILFPNLDKGQLSYISIICMIVNYGYEEKVKKELAVYAKNHEKA